MSLPQVSPVFLRFVVVRPYVSAPCKGIQDCLGFRIPPRGFRIPVTGFRIPCLWIPDSKQSDIPDSKTLISSLVFVRTSIADSSINRH